MRALLLTLALVACGKDERKAADVVERTRARIEAKDVSIEDVAPEVVEDTAVVATEVVTASDVPPTTVTRQVCEAACQNALNLTLGELDPGTATAMRAEIEKALVEKCPTQCVERGSLSAVQCVAAAKTALELAACPR